jgi:hypothetical protein
LAPKVSTSPAAANAGDVPSGRTIVETAAPMARPTRVRDTRIIQQLHTVPTTKDRSPYVEASRVSVARKDYTAVILRASALALLVEARLLAVTSPTPFAD